MNKKTLGRWKYQNPNKQKPKQQTIYSECLERLINLFHKGQDTGRSINRTEYNKRSRHLSLLLTDGHDRMTPSENVHQTVSHKQKGTMVESALC